METGEAIGVVTLYACNLIMNSFVVLQWLNQIKHFKYVTRWGGIIIVLPSKNWMPGIIKSVWIMTSMELAT